MTSTRRDRATMTTNRSLPSLSLNPTRERAARLTRAARRHLLGIVVAGFVGLSPAAGAADFTYSGNGRAVGQGFQGAWSQPSNWAGGAAPSGSVGTLVFPPTPACNAAKSDPNGCSTTDDIHGLSAYAIKLEADYLVGGVSGCFGPCPTPQGDPLTLGGGGITAEESPSDGGYPYFSPALILGAPQTWSIVGNHRGAGLQVARVTGAAEPLRIAFTNTCRTRLRGLCDPHLDFAADAELGAITATGPGAIEITGAPFSLNGTDGNSVAVDAGAELVMDGGASTGPLNFSHGFLQLNTGGSGFPRRPAAVTGTGTVSLDSRSGVTVSIERAGTSPGKDYAQLRAHGAVSLGGAGLTLSGPLSNRYCPRLHRGDLETLITTTGTVSGWFTAWNPIKRSSYKVPNRSILPVNCLAGAEDWNYLHAPRVRITYTKHSVTATVVRARAKR